MPLAARTALLALALLLALAATGTCAQETITVTDTDPRANTVLADAPDAVRVTLSAPVDPQDSTVRLIGEDGREAEGIETTWVAPDTASLTLPPDLPAGSWLVAWDVESDDASGSGFFGFTTGTDRDAAPLTIPDTGFGATGGSAWLAAMGGGLLLLGACMLFAVAPLRLLRTVSPHLDVFTFAGAIVATTGALAWVAALAWDAPHAGWLDRIFAALDGSDGRLLLGAIALVSIHVIVLALGYRRLALLTTLTLPVPLVLLSHAAEEPAGRLPAMTVAWVAIAALGVLAGGVIALVSTDSESLGRYPLAIAIALPVLAFAAAWLLWLFGGDMAAIEATTWGRVATWGVGIALLFALTLVAGLVLVRRVGVRRALAIPAVAGMALALVAGSLMTIDTARDEVERVASQRTQPLTLGNDRAQLILAPGAAGVNHFRLEIDRPSLPRGTEVDVLISLPAQPELGAQAVTLARVDGHAFEYHGTELAIADRWDLEVRLTEPASEPVSAVTSIGLAETAPRISVPAVPWRFADFAGSAGVLLIAVGVAGIVTGLAAGRSPLRLESAGIGAGALLVAAILLGQGRLDPILARGGDNGAAINPDDLTAITRGEEVYATYCLSCHGPELRGDGPAAAGMQPPPADFSEPHTRAHDDSTLIYWVRHGKQGTTMPAFGGKLSDDKIADVLSYIARQQREMDASTPAP